MDKDKIYNLIGVADDVIDESFYAHRIKEIYALFSGGHDSLVSTHYISSHPLFKGVVHIDTGIGIPETQQFVVDVCKKYEWDLRIYKARDYINGKGILDPQIYEDMCIKYGFPNAPQHIKMYIKLKERPLSQFFRNWKRAHPKYQVGVVTGVRFSESSRRLRNIPSQSFEKKGSKIWISPIASWTEDDCKDYIDCFNLPKNPVKANLCMSGECLCGAFAQSGELNQIEFFYPEVGKKLRDLEKEVLCAGFHWGWDESMKTPKKTIIKSGQLCTSCHDVYLKNNEIV